MSSRGQGHQGMRLMKGNVQRNAMSKYEVNMFTNEEVMANLKFLLENSMFEVNVIQGSRSSRYAPGER
jgi:hypothetical protein